MCMTAARSGYTQLHTSGMPGRKQDPAPYRTLFCNLILLYQNWTDDSGQGFGYPVHGARTFMRCAK